MALAVAALPVVLAVNEESTAYNLGRFFGYALVIALVFFGIRALVRRSRGDGGATESATPPGWYANPQGDGERWWDGERWHERFRTGPGAPDDPGPPPPSPPTAR